VAGATTGRIDKTGARNAQDAAHWLLRERQPGDRRVLYLSTFAILCAIAATVLFANGQRNLHRLLGAQQMRVVQPALPVMREKPAQARHLPPRYFSTEDMPAFSTFVRLTSLPAQNLCRFLAEAGLRNEGWRASELDPRSHECPSVLRLFSAAPGGGFDTVFADVKGDAAGRILRLRLKISARDRVNRTILNARAAAILDFVVSESGWSDLSGLGSRVLASGDFSIESHGLRISRRRERLAPESDNLVLTPIFETPAARNAYDYFLATHRLLPVAPRNRTTPEQWHRFLHHGLASQWDINAHERVFARLFPPPG